MEFAVAIPSHQTTNKNQQFYFLLWMKDIETVQLKLKYKNMYWMFQRNCHFSIKTKYQQVLKPIWTYDLQL